MQEFFEFEHSLSESVFASAMLDISAGLASSGCFLCSSRWMYNSSASGALPSSSSSSLLLFNLLTRGTYCARKISYWPHS
jgi:hypothetical protein